MRLIDANKLFLHFNDWQLAEAPRDKTGHEPKEYTSHDMQLMVYETIGDAMCGIDEAPTVDVIPIEWLLKWNKAQATRGLCNVKEMISDWRKENETD